MDGGLNREEKEKLKVISQEIKHLESALDMDLKEYKIIKRKIKILKSAIKLSEKSIKNSKKSISMLKKNKSLI